jgi:hypothetical protein
MTIPMAFKIGSSLFSAMGSFSSASAARRESRIQAELESAKTEEEIRRTAREQGQIQSLTRAITGASGTTGTGSQSIYLKDMQAEQSRELNWLRKVGASNVSAIRRQGNSIASQHTMQGVGSIFTAGIDALSLFSSKARKGKGNETA